MSVFMGSDGDWHGWVVDDTVDLVAATRVCTQHTHIVLHATGLFFRRSPTIRRCRTTVTDRMNCHEDGRIHPAIRLTEQMNCHGDVRILPCRVTVTDRMNCHGDGRIHAAI